MVLEVFHVSEEDSIRIDPKRLRSSVEALFMSAGMPEHDAKIGADCLLSADLRGVDSHGVSNMLRIYIENMNKIPPGGILQQQRGNQCCS